MAGFNPKSKFMARLARANESLLNHLPPVSIPEVFCGAPRTLRESLDVLCTEIPDAIITEQVDEALDRLAILCAVIEHHVIMARIQAPRSES